MIDELTEYLEQQAAQVRIDDRLDDIERGISLVPVARHRRRPRWAAPALVAATAAAVALIGVVAVNRPSSSTVTPAASADGQPTDPAAVPVEVTEPATTAPQPVLAPLPDGSTMQGFTPLCSSTDGIEFDCAVDGYRHAGGFDDGGFDHTGEVQAVITVGSIVNGGCRSTSADGSTWHCALGQRAVDLDLIGQNYLGQTATPGYAAG